MMHARHIFALFAFVALLLPALLGSFAAHAAGVPPIQLQACANDPDNDQGIELIESGLTTKLVTCIKGTISRAVDVMLEEISEYMQPLVTVMLVFAVIVFGMRIMGGEPRIMPKAIGFLIRMGLVVMFSYNLGDMADDVFGVFDWLITLAAGNFSPWMVADKYMGKFLGFATGATLLQGFMGMLSGALYSSTTGMLMFITGVMALLNIIFFFINILFTYLTAFLVIAFLVVLSPLIIPLALFFWTERYFTKWLHVLISAMLVPMLLFAFLNMFIHIFGQLIGETFCPLGYKVTDLLLINPDPATCRDAIEVNEDNPIDFRVFFRMNEPLVAWLMPGDAGTENEMQNLTKSDKVSVPAVQSNVNPFMRRAMNAGTVELPGINLGANAIQVMQQLIFSFIKLWIFGTIMTAMVRRIPNIAADIASINSVGSLSSTSLESRVKGGMANFRERFSGGLKDPSQLRNLTGTSADDITNRLIDRDMKK